MLINTSVFLSLSWFHGHASWWKLHVPQFEGTGVPLQTVATTLLYLPSAGGQYRYTQDLLALEAIPSQPLSHGFSVAGVLPTGKWNPYLSYHPDQVFANYLWRGLTQGFKIGFDHSHPWGSLKITTFQQPEHPLMSVSTSRAKRQQAG